MNSIRILRIGSRAVILVILSVLLAACTLGTSGRQQEVAVRGAEVMPFDLDRTTHQWTPTQRGVDQIVVVDDPDDAEQLDLVREHLRLEAERFSRGDFQDPAAIHGTEMPGLALLRDHDGRIAIAFEELAAGALLRFTTDQQQLVNALHIWAEAQLTDHGAHAESR